VTKKNIFEPPPHVTTARAISQDYWGGGATHSFLYGAAVVSLSGTTSSNAQLSSNQNSGENGHRGKQSHE
jgi:hypothetical protein